MTATLQAEVRSATVLRFDDGDNLYRENHPWVESFEPQVGFLASADGRWWILRGWLLVSDVETVVITFSPDGFYMIADDHEPRLVLDALDGIEGDGEAAGAAAGLVGRPGGRGRRHLDDPHGARRGVDDAGREARHQPCDVFLRWRHAEGLAAFAQAADIELVTLDRGFDARYPSVRTTLIALP